MSWELWNWLRSLHEQHSALLLRNGAAALEREEIELRWKHALPGLGPQPLEAVRPEQGEWALDQF